MIKLFMNLKILIELPTWLGDTIMTTPAISNIIKHYPHSDITIVGSYVSIEAIKKYPNITHTVVDTTKKNKFRAYSLYKLAKELGEFDILFSFRKSFSSKFFVWFIKAKQKYQYYRISKKTQHQAIYYNDFINFSLGTSYPTGNLKLYHDKTPYLKPTLGINAGATYGSAKRWYPNRFASVAKELSDEYDIVLFGSKDEIDMVSDIQNELVKHGVTNSINLAGKTSVSELISNIAGLSLFITNDSGPMHIASSYDIPTIAIFGPTKFKETSPWNSKYSKIVRVDMECSPCMKRVCPLGHHNCMKEITSKMVLDATLS